MPALHAFANPARFLKIARPLTPLLFWAGAVLVAIGCWAGLTQTPPDYLQGESVRITGAKRDDLQAVMALLRKDMADLPLSFDNFRD